MINSVPWEKPLTSLSLNFFMKSLLSIVLISEPCNEEAVCPQRISYSSRGRPITSFWYVASFPCAWTYPYLCLPMLGESASKLCKEGSSLWLERGQNEPSALEVPFSELSWLKVCIRLGGRRPFPYNVGSLGLLSMIIKPTNQPNK